MKNWIRQHISFPFQVFFMGILPAVPWILIQLFESFVFEINQQFMALFGAIYLLWVAMHLMILWRLCHEPFHALANILRSLHQGDYTQRSTTYPDRDAVGNLCEEINILADVLQNNRYAVVESMRQFQSLIDQLDIGVLAFDENQQLIMVNKYISRIYQKQPSELIGLSIDELQIGPLWTCSSGRTLWLDFPLRNSRFLVHSSQYREDGKPQKLFLLSDVKAPLREEERTAWKRLIRVMGHELNNSLTPIISLSNSLKSRIRSLETDSSKKDSSIEALDVIANRAQGLNRFIDDYSKLAKLPDPKRIELDLGQTIKQVVSLVGIPEVKITAGPDCKIHADEDQTYQMLINLLQNANEAISHDYGMIEITWKRDSTDAIIVIDDNGDGIEEGENLFVPFYSTKENGSGIGLVLCRQIIEGMGGSIHLSNRKNEGCRVTIRLPLAITASDKELFPEKE